MSETAAAVDPVERFIYLHALDVLLTSDFALGQFLEDPDGLLKEGFDLHPEDGTLSLNEAFTRAMPDDEETVEALLIHSRIEFLVESMLRSITPEGVAAAADYFHAIGTEKVAKALALTRNGGDDAA
jgi:hypothetical protein